MQAKAHTPSTSSNTLRLQKSFIKITQISAGMASNVELHRYVTARLNATLNKHLTHLSSAKLAPLRSVKFSGPHLEVKGPQLRKYAQQLTE